MKRDADLTHVSPEADLSWFGRYMISFRLLSANAKRYLVGAFLLGITQANIQLLFNLYLREREVTESVIGSILSSRATGAALMALPAGFLLLRSKLKPVLIASSLVFSVSVGMMAMWESVESLWMFALVGGMAFTFYRVAAAPFYMRNSTPTERPMLFSLGFGMMTLSGAVGSLGAGYLVTVFQDIAGVEAVLAHRYALYVGVTAGVFATIPFSFIVAKKPSREERESALSWERVRGRLGIYSKLFIPYFLVGLGAGFVIPFLNIYFRDRFQQTTDEIGVYYFAVSVATFLGTMAAPAIVHKIGKIKTVVFAELLSIPFMLVLAFTGSIGWAVAAFLLRAAFMNMGQPVSTNFSMEVVSEREQGLVNALMMLAWTGSWTFSTSFGGSLIESHGYELPMMITIFLYVLASVLYYIFFRKAETKENGLYVVNVDGLNS
jgi:predicted MFS family arabinose efflux permease